jgi:tetratricopeptide (TPR) repeat protein
VHSYLFERNRYKLSLKSISSARQIAESVEDVDAVLLSDLYRLEGRLYNETNQPIQGNNAFSKAHTFAEKAISAGALDPQDTRVVRTLTGWGNCLNQLGQLDDALALQLKSLRMCELDSSGRHGDAIIIVKLNLGWVRVRREELLEAQSILQQITHYALDSTVEPALYALGNLSIQLADYKKGLYLHSEALRLYVARFGEQHQCVADSLFKVGETLMKLGDRSKATT